KNFIKFFFSSLVLLFPLIACNNDYAQEKMEVEDEPVDSIPVIIEKEAPPYIVTYHLDSIAEMKVFDSIYTIQEKRIIYALNRIEAVRVSAGSVLLIPDSLSTDLNFYAPFPKELDILDTIPKSVLIAQR